MKIVIVDYGMGNVHSIASTLKYLRVSDVIVSADPEILQNSDKIILPGVGSFAKAMQRIREKELDALLHRLSVIEKKPLLGICLGMQLLGVSSPEDGYNRGLGFVNGDISRFDSQQLKVPHVGFNQVQPSSRAKLFEGFTGTPDFYFTHSYRMLSDADINQSTCRYGDEFVAGFEVNNIAGVQFHPELSQQNGLQLLKNFIEKF